MLRRMARPVFADPRNDVAFHRIFGNEDHKSIVIGFLNDVLELPEERRITSISFLPPEQRPKVPELKFSIVDVKCTDAAGRVYVVEMQVLNVEAFERWVVRDVPATSTHGADSQDLPRAGDVVGITVCDFELWPRGQSPDVPMLSRRRLPRPPDGMESTPLLVFLELAKYDASRPPRSPAEKWALFFREAGDLASIPRELLEPPVVEAFERARIARFTTDEWDAFILAGMAIGSARSALSLAEKRGFQQGLREGLASSIEILCDVLGIELTPERRALVDRLDSDAQKALLARLRSERRWPS